VVPRQDSAQCLLSALSAHAALHEQAVSATKPTAFHPDLANLECVAKFQVASDAGQLAVQSGYQDYHGYPHQSHSLMSASLMYEL
jgi:hypothetical protein